MLRYRVQGMLFYPPRSNLLLHLQQVGRGQCWFPTSVGVLSPNFIGIVLFVSIVVVFLQFSACWWCQTPKADVPLVTKKLLHWQPSSPAACKGQITQQPVSVHGWEASAGAG